MVSVLWFSRQLCWHVSSGYRLYSAQSSFSTSANGWPGNNKPESLVWLKLTKICSKIATVSKPWFANFRNDTIFAIIQALRWSYLFLLPLVHGLAFTVKEKLFQSWCGYLGNQPPLFSNLRKLDDWGRSRWCNCNYGKSIRVLNISNRQCCVKPV